MQTKVTPAGTVTDTRDYEAFGVRNESAGNDPLAFGFAGEPYDSLSKLAYHRARWMDPRVGRFLGMDPRQRTVQMYSGPCFDPSFPDGPCSRLHAYSYTNGNPVLHTDPTGLEDMESLEAGSVCEMIVSTNAEASYATTVAEVEATAIGGSEAGTAAVWDTLSAVGPDFPGTIVPKFATMLTPSGNIYLTANAMEHIVEYSMSLAMQGLRPALVRLATQVLMSNMRRAILIAVASGIAYGDPISVENFFFVFAATSEPGLLPALIHMAYWGSSP